MHRFQEKESGKANLKMNGLRTIILIFFVLISSLLQNHSVEQSMLNTFSYKASFQDEIYHQVYSSNYMEALFLMEISSYEITKQLAIYSLNQHISFCTVTTPLDEKMLNLQSEFWSREEVWEEYLEVFDSIWSDVEYFPIPISLENEEYTVNFVDTWGGGRSYGGDRRHEGTDIMTAIDEPGLYPLLSMTDGTVSEKGWLEKGGYRIGITAPNGAYFYYAHLDSYANLEIGDEINAGELLGFVGDSGYGEEGTRGNFATHLHLGIYINMNQEEFAVNPYWILKYIENQKLKYTY